MFIKYNRKLEDMCWRFYGMNYRTYHKFYSRYGYVKPMT